MTTYTITDGYGDISTHCDLRTAQTEAESLISEGQGDSFQWESDWYEFDGECSHQRDYSVDGEYLTIGIITR